LGERFFNFTLTPFGGEGRGRGYSNFTLAPLGRGQGEEILAGVGAENLLDIFIKIN